MEAAVSPSLLLDRLARSAPSRAAEVRSIVAHLHALLNARQGSSTSTPSYGLLDLLPLLRTFPDSRQALCDRLCVAISAYEPRLRQVRVVQVEAPCLHTLQFHIEASLRTGDPVRLTTRLVDGERLQVEP